MSANIVVLEGRIPHFEPNYKKGDDSKSSHYIGALSVKRNYKPEDEKYYPEDLIPIKTFGAKADFLYNNFKAGDGITIHGTLVKGDDYEKDGEIKKGGLYVQIKEIFFTEGNSRSGDSEDKPAKKSPTSSKKTSPLTNKKSNNPLLSGKKKSPWAK